MTLYSKQKMTQQNETQIFISQRLCWQEGWADYEGEHKMVDQMMGPLSCRVRLWWMVLDSNFKESVKNENIPGGMNILEPITSFEKWA